MSGSPHTSYLFGSFHLDTSRRTLLRDGHEVPLTPKAFEMLVILVESGGKVVTKEDLKQRLWPDSVVEEGNITVQKRALTVALGEGYIQTVPRIGYRFTAEVRRESEGSGEAVGLAVPPESPDDSMRPQGADPGHNSTEMPLPSDAVRRSSKVRWAWLLSGALAGVILSAVAFVIIARRYAATRGTHETTGREVVLAPADEAEIMRVVKESQVYETLGIYVSPSDYDAGRLRQYWLPSEQGGKEVAKIEASVKRLLDKGLYYGRDSRVERFDFRYVRVYSPRDYAEAGTVERWYVPLRRADDSLVEGRNVYLGPYTVDYILRKVDGRWLLEESSTPRATN